MSEANGTTTVVVETPAGAPATVTLDNATGLPVEGSEASSETTAVEAVADSSVEIARIEADKEITIAAIHADTEATRIEADAEHERDLAWHREELANLRAQNLTLETRVSELVAQSTPQVLVEEPETVILEPTETMTTSEPPTEGSSSTGTEASGKSAVERAAEAVAEIAEEQSPLPATVPVKRKARMI